MTAVVLVLTLTFVIAAVFLAVVASLMQNSYYERVIDGLPWRALMAAAVVTSFLGLWGYLEYSTPGRFDSFFSFGASDDRQLEHFWSEKKSDSGVTLTLFHRQMMTSGRVEYHDANGRAWRRSDDGVVTAIIIEEDGERHRFAAKLGPNDTFVCSHSDPNTVEEVRYVEEHGRHRVMTEGLVGTLHRTRYGALFLNTFFNFTFLFVWVVTMAVAFEFQWAHAFVIGAIGWNVSLLLIWPVLQQRIAVLNATI